MAGLRALAEPGTAAQLRRSAGRHGRTPAPQARAGGEKLFRHYTQDLFRLNLRFVPHDLTSSYFEGDGVCELAEFGHSRDHRSDRRQVMWGMAITPEGLPITQRVFQGNTGDTKTLLGTTKELRERFGLARVMIVVDQSMFSAENVAELEAAGQPYLLAIRVRSMKLGGRL